MSEKRDRLYIELGKTLLRDRFKLLIEKLRVLDNSMKKYGIEIYSDGEVDAFGVGKIAKPMGNYEKSVHHIHQRFYDEFDLNNVRTVLFYDIINTEHVMRNLDDLVRFAKENNYKTRDFINRICVDYHTNYISDAIAEGYKELELEFIEKDGKDKKTKDESLCLGTLSYDKLKAEISSRNYFSSNCRIGTLGSIYFDESSGEFSIYNSNNYEQTTKTILDYLFNEITGTHSEKLTDEMKENVFSEYRELAHEWCYRLAIYDKIRYASSSSLRNIDNVFAEWKQRNKNLIQKSEKHVIEDDINDTKRQTTEITVQIGDDEPKELDIAELNNYVLTHHYTKYTEEMLANKELMYYVASQSDVKPELVNYVSKELQNDFHFISLLILNSNIDTFDFYVDSNMGASKLRYEQTIGIDIKTNPMFWALLNAKILILNRERELLGKKSMEQFNVEKELLLAEREKASILKLATSGLDARLAKNEDQFYLLEFEYENIEQKKMIYNLFQERLIYKYGVRSERNDAGERCIMSYFVDENGSYITDDMGIIGGVKIPKELLTVLVKNLMEEYNVNILVGNKKLNGKFYESELSVAARELNLVAALSKTKDGMYLLEFDYENDNQKHDIFNVFEKELISSFGSNSTAYHEDGTHIVPYLIDNNGKYVTYNSGIVGGVKIPMDLLYEVLKVLMEKHDVTVVAGNEKFYGILDINEYTELLTNLSGYGK